jgi:hypothetical protein
MSYPPIQCSGPEYRSFTINTINRHHEYLCRHVNMNALNSSFGILDTDYIRYSIQLCRTSQFRYLLKIKKSTIYSPFDVFIEGLPKDMIREIYSFLWQPNLQMKLRITLPLMYPFDVCRWKVLSYVRDGKQQDTSKETQNIQCMMNDSSPSMKLDSEILYLASVIL